MKSESDPIETKPGSLLSALVVAFAGLWLLAGGYFKLTKGSPATLPLPVREFTGWLGLDLVLAYKLTITTEFCLAGLAILRPRWAWPLLIGALLTFIAILVPMLGEDSCGCFGPDFPIEPKMMLIFDSSILLALLLTRPWSRLPRGGAGLMVVTLILAIGVAIPWVFDRELKGPVEPVAEGQSAPAQRPYVILDVESWVGQEVWNTPLIDVMDVGSSQPEGLWVFYRSTCDHCAKHLAQLSSSETGERPITLIRIKEPADNEANRAVHAMPVGDYVFEFELSDQLDYVITTPADMTLEGGIIQSAREGVEVDEH